MKLFKVFKLERALKCREQGFEILYTEPNRKNRDLSVFVFEDSDKFRKCFTESK